MWLNPMETADMVILSKKIPKWKTSFFVQWTFEVSLLRKQFIFAKTTDSQVLELFLNYPPSISKSTVETPEKRVEYVDS